MAKVQGGKAATGKAAAKKRVVKVDSYGDAHIVASFTTLFLAAALPVAALPPCAFAIV